MSTRADGGLISAHKQSIFGPAHTVAKPGLKDFMNQNAMYEDVLEKINQKLALKDAIDRANQAIASSKQGSRMGEEDQKSQMSRAFDTSTQHSKLSVSQYSHRSSRYAPSEHQSKASIRSTAQDLVQTLHVQLERER